MPAAGAGKERIMEAAAMTNAQMYFAIAVPTFTVIFGMSMNIIVLIWQARGIENRIDTLIDMVNRRIDAVEARLDKIERALEVIQGDLKQFYADVTRLKQRSGM